MPHEGFPWSEPVYAGTHILNGYGELIGINSIREWGILIPRSSSRRRS